MTSPAVRSGAHTPKTALVVGASGIAGSAIVDLLAADGTWTVLALSRKPSPGSPARHIAADLLSPDSLSLALRDEKPTHVFFTAWARQDTEQENIRVNVEMLRNLLGALDHAPVEHVALMTGLKHYLGPFESYGAGPVPDTPFREDEPRLPAPNFYYAQEDELWAAAERQGYRWSVHRAHTVIGHAVGNAMNMGLTLAAQATLCKELGRPFVFPGSEMQWNGITDMTDSDLLAEHMLWAATTEEAGNQAYNVVNGDVFRWRWMWPKLAAYFGVKAEGFVGSPRPLEEQMGGMGHEWSTIAAARGLAEADLARVASWWHTDADLGRNIEVLADMSKSRLAGFDGYRRTEDCFIRLFDRYRGEKIIP
ncbi:nucleoside-diphosphate-sugar epimerase [Arthrobacter sp. B3I9]|uniref:SDR family oxidoreductase n=1 Tax=Arthrobacter sp. B3I9 TaxID=3042270 RepID=UPI00278FBC37|nr:SDR family oxidoreductase [Arthrobacter sp. B3I9]MDQ0850198.1 nucleoside-diphosphate-sugar epimerase [Arthrobacter sp. B3I9]